MPADDSGCAAGAYQAIELVADVAPSPGNESILASYAHGIVVLDREGRLVASTTGYPCEGSADEIEALAAGTAYGDTTIAVVANSGGRREHVKWIGLFRLGFAKRLDPVFAAIVEDTEEIGGRGAIYMLPGALVYRLPNGRHALYVFDPIGRFYRVPVDPLDDPDHEPRTGPPQASLVRS